VNASPTKAPVKAATTKAPTKAPVQAALTKAPTKSPTKAPIAGPAAITFTLVNANTDLDIGPLTNGTVVHLNQVGTLLNIRADPSTTGLSKVVFGYDGNSNFHTETVAVYAFAGNNGPDYLPMTVTVGTHTVTATAYIGTTVVSTGRFEEERKYVLSELLVFCS
jgi:hypothetical protein